jgi:hypothetical protein
VPAIVKFVCDKTHLTGTPTAAWPIMPEPVSFPPKPKPVRTSADKDALVHVEQWMAVIREIVRDQAKASLSSIPQI